MIWTTDFVKEASKHNHIIAGFNVFGYEDAQAVVIAAERAKTPVLLMVNRDARSVLEVEHWASLLSSIAKKSSVPVGVHLDHTTDLDIIKRAIDSGFTSVMYDGSKRSFNDNLENTRMITDYAHKQGVLVEGELGAVPYDDIGETLAEWTSPEEAEQMANETELDWLAVSVGNIHRLVGRTAPIKFDILKSIEKQCPLPLVIHGSSGIIMDDIQKLLCTQVGKMNFGTVLRKVFGDTLRAEMETHPNEFDRLRLFEKPIKQVEETAYQLLINLTLEKGQIV